MSETKIIISAQDNASRVLANVRKDLGSVGAAAARLSPILAGLGVSLSGTAAFAWLKGINDGIDALNDLRDATGSSIENLSALEDIAGRTGTSFDTVGSALVKFNSALKDAKPNSSQEQAFRALGLSLQNLRDLDPAEALRQTSLALASFADDGNKARLVQDLFGKSVREVAPFLKDLAEAGKLNATVTTEQADAVDKYNKQIAALQKNALDLERQLAGPLVKALNDTADAFRRSGDAGKGFFESISDRYIQNVKDFYASIGIGTEKKVKFVVDYAPPNESAAEAARLLRRRSIELPSGGRGGPSRTAVAKETDEQTSALDRYIQSLTQSLEREKDLSAVQTAQLRIAEAGAQGFSEAKRQYILDVAAQIDAEKALKAAQQEANTAQEERIRLGRAFAIEQGVDNSARADRLSSLLDNTDEVRLAKIREDVALLAEELDAGRLEGGVDQYIQAVQARIGAAGKEIEKTKSLADDLGLTFSSAFENAIVGGGKLSDVLKGLGDDILRITVRKSITEPLGGFFTGLLGNLFSFDGGGFTGSGARAGGMDGKGGFMAMLHPNETVIDHTKGGASNVTYVTNNFTVGDVPTMSFVQKALAQTESKIYSTLVRSSTHGGAFAQ